ncbi:hypothetical protein GGI05_004048, partial [Coemansia sp. RSA 2603]
PQSAAAEAGRKADAGYGWQCAGSPWPAVNFDRNSGALVCRWTGTGRGGSRINGGVGERRVGAHVVNGARCVYGITSAQGTCCIRPDHYAEATRVRGIQAEHLADNIRCISSTVGTHDVLYVPAYRQGCGWRCAAVGWHSDAVLGGHVYVRGNGAYAV